MLRKGFKILVLGIGAFTNVSTFANQCSEVRFSDVGWTDITATTAITTHILKGLGYQTSTELLSIPVTYSSLANQHIDVFLGNWMPTMEKDIQRFRDNGSIEILGENLTGAKYTLAVPKYVYDAGVTSFTDIKQYREKFHHKIYGIEPGNDGNRLIQKMIQTNAFGLKDFTLVESSEAGMISSIEHALKNHQWIVFLGWAPHPMNTNFNLEYLSGGDNYFGPNYGEASVYTNARKGYTQECPNVSQFLTNLKFNLSMENQLMNSILNHEQSPSDAAIQWLKDNPQALAKWLDGVKTIDGQPAIAAVTRYLKNH